MFSVLAAATFSPRTRETPDLLSCCKKLFPLDKTSSFFFSEAWAERMMLATIKVGVTADILVTPTDIVVIVIYLVSRSQTPPLFDIWTAGSCRMLQWYRDCSHDVTTLLTRPGYTP